MKLPTSHEGLHCANCGATMQGEFCHECGQSIHSVLQPMHHMVEETVETVLHIDSRIVHTLPPLFLKPGFLTLEYFAGRRVRYIAPFRLMFVLCLLSFFVFHLAVDRMSDQVVSGKHPTASLTAETVKDADTPKEVRKILKRQLATLPVILASGALSPSQVDLAAEDIRQKANKRLVELGAAPMPAATTAIPSSTAAPSTTTKESDQVRISWLPKVANARLTALFEHIQANWHAFKEGDPAASAEARQRMISGVFGILPATMFVMMPLFALLLKLFYVFRRRLYMEHLIVALHSHAFLFLWLLLLTLLVTLARWLVPHVLWANWPVNWLERILLLWAPVYLLLMQKRVYRQGWPMTLLKFWCVGWCYFWLLTFALMVAIVLGIAH